MDRMEDGMMVEMEMKGADWICGRVVQDCEVIEWTGWEIKLMI